ncbi:DNA primase family protein [Anoxybacillus gonensis]|uniref:DNA primase family protein n=1 Tax=Anoxybacillus gonensis TaxID=198467 RepID=UPI003D766F59
MIKHCVEGGIMGKNKKNKLGCEFIGSFHNLDSFFDNKKNKRLMYDEIESVYKEQKLKEDGHDDYINVLEFNKGDVPKSYLAGSQVSDDEALKELQKYVSENRGLKGNNMEMRMEPLQSNTLSISAGYELDNKTDIHDLVQSIRQGDVPAEFFEQNEMEGIEALHEEYQKAKAGGNKKTIEELLEKDNNQKIKNVDYDVYIRLLKRHIFKCCEGRMYLYDENTGCFKELNDNQLKIVVRSDWPKEIERLLTKSKVDDIIDRLKSCNKIQVGNSDFDSYTHFINFKNGVLNLTNWKLYPHSPKYNFSSFINAQYNVNVQGKVFMNFIRQCTDGDATKENLIQEILGYVISNYTTAKKFFVFIGKPHTGKSTLLDVLKEIVGEEYTTSIPIHQLGERFMKAKLFRAKLNISGEMTDVELKNLDTLKALTGNDDIVAENKGKDPFTFKCKAKLIFAGNHMPRLYKLDSTSAFFDRIIFVLFNNSVPERERDYQLKEKLLAERDYIVVWALQGLKRLIKNNFVFTECEESKRFKNQYIKDMNTVLGFIENCCILDRYDKSVKIHKRDLYRAYINYCKDNCVKALDSDEFFVEIKKLPVEIGKFRYNGSTPLEGFRGISLKERFIADEISY